MKGRVFWKNAIDTKMSSRPMPRMTNGARKWMKLTNFQPLGAEYTSHEIGKDICASKKIRQHTSMHTVTIL